MQKNKISKLLKVLAQLCLGLQRFLWQRFLLVLCLCLCGKSVLTFAAEKQNASRSEKNKNSDTKSNAVTVEGSLRDLNLPDLEPLLQTVEKLRAENAEVRHKLLSLQDEMASMVQAFADFSIELFVDNTEARQQKPQAFPLGVRELSLFVDNVELIKYEHPVPLAANERFLLFEGPVPFGRYRLTVKGVAGAFLYNFPFSLLQGEWAFKHESELVVDKSTRNKLFTFVLKPRAQNLVLQVGEKKP